MDGFPLKESEVVLQDMANVAGLYCQEQTQNEDFKHLYGAETMQTGMQTGNRNSATVSASSMLISLLQLTDRKSSELPWCHGGANSVDPAGYVAVNGNITAETS